MWSHMQGQKQKRCLTAHLHIKKELLYYQLRLSITDRSVFYTRITLFKTHQRPITEVKVEVKQASVASLQRQAPVSNCLFTIPSRQLTWNFFESSKQPFRPFLLHAPSMWLEMSFSVTFCSAPGRLDNSWVGLNEDRSSAPSANFKDSFSFSEPVSLLTQALVAILPCGDVNEIHCRKKGF